MIIPGRGTAPSVPVVIPIPSRRKTTYHSSLSEHGTNADFLEFVMPLRDEKTFTDEEYGSPPSRSSFPSSERARRGSRGIRCQT
jgi:hypothetical protein